MGNVNGQTVILPDLKAGAILQALGDTLPEADLSRLRAFLAGEGPLDVGDADARRIVDALKTAADRYWNIDPHRSNELADAIIEIGIAQNDIWVRALGMMAKGDAVKFLGSQQTAWDLLEEAANLFTSIGDEVGWARTWIGRLFFAAQLNRLPEVIAHVERARDIFARNGEMLRLMRLEMTLGTVNWQAENHVSAESHYKHALSVALALGKSTETEARGIYNNLGLIAQSRGDPNNALDYFDRAARLAHEHGEESAELICRLNMATSRRQLGQFRQALALLHEIRPRYLSIRGSDTQIRSDMADCLMALNRFEEADALYGQARHAWLAEDVRLYAARAALLQAMAEAGLGDAAGARALLNQAEAEFSGLKNSGLSALVQLRRGQLALREREPAQALAHARESASRFDAEGQVHLRAEASLLEADALLGMGDTAGAGKALVLTLQCARACASPALLYSAHLSLGLLAEREGKFARALRRYAAAEAVLERLQRNLTVTLRPAFLASALDAQRARVLLLLRLGNVAAAFDTVERLRAQIVLGYLTGRESLKLPASDQVSIGLADELDELRGRHHALTVRGLEDTSLPAPPGDELAKREAIHALERQMRSITEQLHLRRSSDGLETLKAPRAEQLQAALGEGEAMIAYFDDGVRLRAFFINRGRITHLALSASSGDISRAMDQLQRNTMRALASGSASAAATLVVPARMILKRLWDMLLAPLDELIDRTSRIFIVPFGQLHALPFNLLFDGGRHLIERGEIVTLPSASVLLQSSPCRPAGTRILVHNDSGRLPDVEREADVIRAILSAEVWSGTAATRESLHVAPMQILHIAAHGAHRTDNPDFSYIALSDGQLMIDDLLKMDMSYELVTLSACETGRGRITAGDEALGIGWAFLYAGAGAVVSSLWRVSDARTAPLMAAFYGALREGLSKATALRRAQLAALAQATDAHPAFWGAFQLVGSPAALSSAGTE